MELELLRRHCPTHGEYGPLGTIVSCPQCYDTLDKDARRYRWLRDRSGNDIMGKLMKECRPDEWDKLVDLERGAVSASPVTTEKP